MNEDGLKLSLDSRRFELPVSFRNLGGPEHEFIQECVVDTGCPDALALPADYEEHLEVFRTHVERGGAGRGTSKMFSIEITKLGDVEVAHETMAVTSLKPGYPHALLGIDILRQLFVQIDGEPHEKIMSISFDFIDRGTP